MSVVIAGILRSLDVSRCDGNSFTVQRYRAHLDSLVKGTIAADTDSRALYSWGADKMIYRIYTGSVPLTKLRHTGIVTIQKVEPDFPPTAFRMERYLD